MSFGPALREFIRNTIGSLLWYAQHPGQVVAQASDGSVEVKPDSPAVGPQKNVPLRLGVPGIKVKVGPGTRVRMYYAGGEDGASEVALWEGDGLLELELDASVKVTVKAPQVVLDAADVRLGGAPATQPVVLGLAYRSGEAAVNAAWGAFLTALGTYAGAIKAIADPAPAPTDPTTTLTTAITAMAAAIASFEGGSAGYLSTTVKTK
jgi:hypothetical protein